MGLMRVQFANADVRHEGATILTSLYPELTYITGETLINGDGPQGSRSVNNGTARQLLVPPTVCDMLASQRTVDPPTFWHELTRPDKPSPMASRLSSCHGELPVEP